MKTVATKNQMPSDTIQEDPGISFQHLSSCFFFDDAMDNPVDAIYGFPFPEEENLYKTGCLMKEFLKC